MGSLDFESIAIAIGLFFTSYQLRQNWKSQSIDIELKFKDRYDDLNEDRKEFYFLYQDANFDLKNLKREKKKLYQRVINWESRYFHYEFDKYLLGHVRKIIPRELKVSWDYSLKSAMQKPIHRQAWEQEIRKEDFLGNQKFYKFVDSCATGKCDDQL